MCFNPPYMTPYMTHRNLKRKEEGYCSRITVLTPPQQPGELEEPEEPEELEEVVKNRQLEPVVSESGVAVGDAGNQDGKMKRICNNFSERQEEVVVEWFIDNPLLYNKCLKEYKNKEKKTVMWTEMAVRLDLPGT